MRLRPDHGSSAASTAKFKTLKYGVYRITYPNGLEQLSTPLVQLKKCKHALCTKSNQAAFQKPRVRPDENQRQRFSLGPLGNPKTETKLTRLMAEHSAGDLSQNAGENYTAAEAIADYLEHAANWYQKDGQRTSRFYSPHRACRVLVDLYGNTPANDFSATLDRLIRTFPRQYRTLRRNNISWETLIYRNA